MRAGLFLILGLAAFAAFASVGAANAGLGVATPWCGSEVCTGVNKILGSKVESLFHFETCTSEGRGGEKGGSANSRTKHTEPLTLGVC